MIIIITFNTLTKNFKEIIWYQILTEEKTTRHNSYTYVYY